MCPLKAVKGTFNTFPDLCFGFCCMEVWCKMAWLSSIILLKKKSLDSWPYYGFMVVLYAKLPKVDDPDHPINAMFIYNVSHNLDNLDHGSHLCLFQESLIAKRSWSGMRTLFVSVCLLCNLARPFLVKILSSIQVTSLGHTCKIKSYGCETNYIKVGSSCRRPQKCQSLTNLLLK